MSAPCPPQEQLERLRDDRLETSEDAALAQHRKLCGCQARLERRRADGLPLCARLRPTPR
jgi:hypothetical protein